MFFIDLVLNFFIAFPSNTPHGVVWETRLSKIGMKYLKGWPRVCKASGARAA